MTLRYEVCNKLLSNPTAMVALSFPTSVPASRVLMARLDLDKIAETLRPTQAALAKHVRIVEQDRHALHDNILEAGLAGVW